MRLELRDLIYIPVIISGVSNIWQKLRMEIDWSNSGMSVCRSQVPDK